jgi:peptide/nickel transport system permease protein
MTRYLLGRAAALLLTLLAASAVVFAVTDLLPGDPAAYMMGLNADPQAVAALRAELGLDEPALERYVSWLAGMARGDFGVSYTYRTPVADLMAERAAVSIPLAVFALALSTAAAIGLALLSVAQRGRWTETAVTAAAQAGVAAPNFWVALILVYVFATGLGWFAAGGFPGWDAGLWPALRALILPAVALALPQAAILTRVTRSALLETLDADYVRTARAKGASRWRALTAHALPNALIPVLTILGLQFSFLLAGAVIIENVFYLPGLGRLVLQAVAQRDLIVVQGVVMALVFATVVVTFVVDLLYAAADPRLRHREAPA